MLELRAVYTAFSTQNLQQLELIHRFERIVEATRPDQTKFFAHELQLAQDDGRTDSFRTANWYHALAQKTLVWAEAADKHRGELILAADNDITLLPGWAAALVGAFVREGPLDVCFQREGGVDPFFEPFPYNSGLFLMNGSARVSRFWREVSARTMHERPFAGDQTIVNSMLMTGSAWREQMGGLPGCTDTAGLRHGHFPPDVVIGGPSVPQPKDKLRQARVHHATGSGSAAGKLHALDTFLDACAWSGLT
jgi:hypothetical protein